MTCRPPNSRKSNFATEPQIERLGLQMLPHPLPKGPQGQRGATPQFFDNSLEVSPGDVRNQEALAGGHVELASLQRHHVASPGSPLPHGSLQEGGIDALSLVGLLHILTDKL